MIRRFQGEPLIAPGDRVVLSAEVSHHVLHVVQVPRDTVVVLFDGDGHEAPGRLVAVEDGRAVVLLDGPPRRAAASRQLVLIAGLPRKPAWEHALRMATELGATEIRGFVADRSVAKGLQTDRWARVVAAAVGQCGRGDTPELQAWPTLAAALVGLPDQRWLCVPGAGSPRLAAADAAVLIGPEGGLSEREQALAVSAGFVALGLSPWTLRADTAVAAALSRLSDPGD